MGKVIKIAKHACICPVCNGNGFIQRQTDKQLENLTSASASFKAEIKKEIIQCEQCNSSGELEIQEPTLEFLESFGSKRLQWLKML